MEKEPQNQEKTPKNPKTDVKTSTHATRYLFVGLTLTVFNYGFYTVLSNLIIKNNDFLWLSTLISTLVTTIIAYLMHSKITWKERNITKAAVYKFFIWNLLLTFPIGPGFTQLFSLITPIYDFAYNICQNLGLSFTYDFVQSTGAFIFTSAATMILNFLFYDRFVFGKTKAEKEKK